MKNIFLSLTTLLFIGCGSSDNEESTKVDAELAHEGIVKVQRSDWESVNKPYESSLGVLSKSIDKGILELYIKKGSRSGNHIQFFIDSDYNEGTGYKSDMVDGADYLIEDGRVYKSTKDGKGWNWNQIANTYFTNRYYYVYTKADNNTIPSVKSNFRVAAFSLNDSWHIVSNISMKPINRGVIVVDASVSDWEGIPQLAQSEIGEFKVIDDSDKLYLLIHKGNVGKHIQVFINSDNNKNTGYVNDRLNGDSGADYYIEDNRLYKSTKDGKEWAWEKIGFVSYSKDNNIIEMSIPKEQIGLTNSDSVSLGLVAWDAKYDNVVSKLNMQQKALKNDKSIVINEIMAENAHTLIDPDFTKFSDWIEIHNKTANSIDIGNYKLSDSLGEQKWKIPEGTLVPANGYKLFWADGEDTVKTEAHTNFTLKSKGEAIALYDVDNKLVDGFSFGKQQADVSATSSNGNVVYMNPTAKRANETTISALDFAQNPEFSPSSSFFDANGGTVEISAQNADKIYYTTDGSFPTKNSSVYNGSIDISKNTTLRARAEENGKLLSSASTRSYFVNVSSDLPIVSLSTNDSYLFDDTVGIYTIGTNGAKTYGCNGPSFANYFQKWKRPANIEYYDKTKTLQFSQEFDIKISGSCSRTMDQKSFSVKADKKYGKSFIDYKLFPHKDIANIKGFKLRNGGQDWYSVMLRDAFLQQLVKDDMDVDYQDYRPVVVFINGEYWGIHNIREKKNEDFLAENHNGVDAKKVDILEDNMHVNEGTNENYKEMIEFIQTHNLSDEASYNTVSEMMDIENYMDYIIAETYFANSDWGYTNIRYWREATNSPKWRWILEDLDLAMGQYGDDVSTNMLDFMTDRVNPTDKNPLWSTFLFTSLLENSGFKSRFKQKYLNYLNGTFNPNTMTTLLDSLTDKIKTEIPKHTDRWKDSDPHSVGGSNGGWESKITHLKSVINSRNQVVKDELSSF